MEDGVKFHQLPLWQQIKDVLFVDEKDRFILALIRGDYEVNEVKLKHLTGALDLRHATDEEIRNKVKSEPGFLSPVGIKDRVQSEIILVGDQSLRTVVNAYGGANQLHQDFLNINIDRDYKPDLEGDIALAKNGYLSTTEKQLIAKRGIEVGNIFQLGYHYSKKMHDAFFVDRDGKTKPFYMGCYGIGVGRTLAAIVEKYHDGHGILWPRAIAPFQLHFIALNIDDPEIQRSSDYLYSYFMNHGLEILYDDRPGVSPGEKFGDADLIGLPYRLIVSKKTAGKIEYKERAAKTSQLKTPEEILKSIIR